MIVLLAAVSTAVISTKAVAIAASVFAVLQVVKKFTNWSFLQGKAAVAANVGLVVIGTISTTAPSNLLTTDTLIAVLTASFLAAGFHAIVTTVVPAVSANPTTPTLVKPKVP